MSDFVNLKARVQSESCFRVKADFYLRLVPLFKNLPEVLTLLALNANLLHKRRRGEMVDALDSKSSGSHRVSSSLTAGSFSSPHLPPLIDQLCSQPYPVTMPNDFNQPSRLAVWINNNFWLFFGLNLLGMTIIYLGDLYFQVEHPLMPWLPPVEFFGFLLLAPIIKWTKRRIPAKTFRNPTAYMLGHFGLVLALLMIPVVWGFQALSWMVEKHYQGASFYWPSLVLAVIMAYRQKPGTEDRD